MRSHRFRGRHMAIVSLVLLGVIISLGYYAYDYWQSLNEATTRVEMTLASDAPSYDSPYCRWVFGIHEPEHEDCLHSEQVGFTKFNAAWDRNIAALRKQMILCLGAAQSEQGVSWKAAADCAQVDADNRPDSRSKP